ncbi:hypothetical protein LCGC14_1364470 [marine sediment metagenome]|uniref:Uncharacterized protein n=1 Tax=marine sediment metagenome TaxID=412755 RepID=A0A0F9N993_9ZZZZ
MEAIVNAKLDRSKDGYIRKTKDGYYRMSFSVCNKEGKELFEVRGFKIDNSLRTIIPPTSVTRAGRMYQIAIIDHNFTTSMLAWAKEQVEAIEEEY